MATSSGLTNPSDMECQCCSHAYLSELKAHKISISMTQNVDPLEWTIAERANGILKTEMNVNRKRKGST